MVRSMTLAVILLAWCRLGIAAEYSLPEKVRVLPVAFVPADEKPPTEIESRLFLRHLDWAQGRYREMLGHDTFELAKSSVQVVKGKRPLDFYRAPPERGAPDIVSELLTQFELTRFDCPFVFCILMMNSKDSFPEGGGRTINGGINTGGGMMYIASGELTRNSHFQTTLQHELGHAFGLPHVDVYGYDMKSNASIMSYNPAHHCREFTPSSTPGSLIPEDRRVLAFNDRVFARTTFNPVRDIPVGYRMSDRLAPLGPMTLPGQPDFYPEITTSAGEDLSSKITSIVREQIKANTGPGITFDPGTMWHSRPLPDGMAVLEITFPLPVRLTGVGIHSQHSGKYHEASAVRIASHDHGSKPQLVDQLLSDVNEIVTFPATTARRWTITLTSGPSKIIVLRGLRFFDGSEEIFPHMIPYSSVSK